MRVLLTTFTTLGLMAAISTPTSAAGTTKDIVLDRISAPAAASTAVAPAGSPSDAMAVSVLLESEDGTLTPRSTGRAFSTGDRFRVKLLASRAGQVAFFNTNPRGVMNPEPVWRGEVELGQELISPRLRLQGQSGVDQLHIVLVPAQQQSVAAWLGNWLGRIQGGQAKDIGLDVQDTTSATYLLNARGQGLVTTMRIAHR